MAVVAVAVATWTGSAVAGSIAANLLISASLTALQSALQRYAMRNAPRAGIQTEHTSEGGVRPMSFILGRYATGGHMICPPMWHGRDRRNHNIYLTYVVSLSDVPGAGLDRVVINDQLVEFEAAPVSIPQGGPVPAGMPADWYERQGMDPANPAASIPQIGVGRPALGRHAGYCWLSYYDGSQSSADPYLMQVYGPGTAWAAETGRPWTADMVGRGTCYAILTFRLNPDLWQGQPRCRFELSGIPVYDPRRDSTRGGNGPQRADNPATWVPSSNAMLLAYNILRGIPIEGGPYWGYGVPDAALPLADWVPVLNACDVVVDGDPAWRAGLEIGVDTDPADALDEILKTCTGAVAETGGVWKPSLGAGGAPVWHFSDADVLISSPASATPFPGLNQTYNGVHASYPEPAQLWQTKDAPPRYNATWEASDGNRRLIAELALPACPYGGQVQRVMRAYIEEERRFRSHVVPLPPEAALLEPLDNVSWTSAEHGYDAKLFRVTEAAEDLLTGEVTIAIRERDPADYSWRPDFRLPSVIAPVGTPPPEPILPERFAAMGIALTDDQGRARRAGARLVWGGWALDGVTGVRWEVQQGGQTLRGVMADPTRGEHIVTDLLPDTPGQARISFEGGGGSGWTGWEQFTTPDVRLAKVDLDREVLADVDLLSGWMDDTGPFLRDLRGEIAGLRDSIAEVDWGNYTIHNRVRREASAEVAAARAAFTEEINVAASETEAVATRVTALTATVDANTAAITQEQLARANADGALALDIQSVRATAAGNTAGITQERMARIAADQALAADITTVSSSLGTKASASAVTALTTRVANTEAGITTQSDAITQVQARTDRGTASGLLRVAAAGTPTGTQSRIGLRAEAAFDDTSHSAALFLEANSDGTSACTVVADRFAIVQHTGVGAVRSVPFVVQGGAVYMDIAFIRDLEVDTIKIKNGALTQMVALAIGTTTIDSTSWITVGSLSIPAFSNSSLLSVEAVFDGVLPRSGSFMGGGFSSSGNGQTMQVRMLLAGQQIDLIEMVRDQFYETGNDWTVRIYPAVRERMIGSAVSVAGTGTNTVTVQARVIDEWGGPGFLKGLLKIREDKR